MLPNEVFDGLPRDNLNLMDLVVSEIKQIDNDEENMQNATDCLIQLIVVTGKREVVVLQNYILQ